MKKTLILLATLVLVSACGKENKTKVNPENSNDKAKPAAQITQVEKQKVDDDLTAISENAGLLADAGLLLQVDEEGKIAAGEESGVALVNQVKFADKEAVVKLIEMTVGHLKSVKESYATKFLVDVDGEQFEKKLSVLQSEQIDAQLAVLALASEAVEALEAANEGVEPESEIIREQIVERLKVLFNFEQLASQDDEAHAAKIDGMTAGAVERPPGGEPPVVGGG